MYDGAFYEEISEDARSSAAVVVPLLTQLLGQVDSVLDLGCGQGTWLAAFVAAGAADVVGVDGEHVDRRQLEIPEDRFIAADLSVALQLERSFDLALSLEVAEHLPESAADAFVGSLVASAPVVLFSAAIPGQGGVNHVNERWPAWWAERFAGHGYHACDVLRPLLWQDERVRFYYAQNMVLYVSDSMVADVLARASSLPPPPSPPPLVHPELLDARTRPRRAPPPSVRSLLRQLPPAARRAAAARLGRG